ASYHSLNPGPHDLETTAMSLTFAQPVAFWLLIAPLLLLGLRWRAHRKRQALLDGFVGSRLQSTLVRNANPVFKRIQFVLFLLSLIALITALARPQYGFIETEVSREGLDIVVALDTSRSMLADDIRPNRLTRAKFAIQDLLDSLQGDRIGLVAFAGDAFLQCPMTIDYGAFQRILESVNTGVIPTGGTNLSRAMEIANQAFNKSEGEDRALILVTDGEELDEDGVAMARTMGDGGVRVFTVGMGTPQGSRIPVRENGRMGFVRDQAGQRVISKLDESRLREVSEAAGGFYRRFENAGTIETLIQDGLDSMAKSTVDVKAAKRPIERFQWALGLGLIMVLVKILVSYFEKRRSYGPQKA
ncbi:MAG: VWA domain-containing protein, partial [Verrucomicrobiota bacterium]